MTTIYSERRLIENEMIFRQANEQVTKSLSKLTKQFARNGNSDLSLGGDTKLFFICECSDENCDLRIGMSTDRYQSIHEQRDEYIIKPNHQVEAVEKVVKRYKEYWIVSKNNSIPESAVGDTLHDTAVDNS